MFAPVAKLINFRASNVDPRNPQDPRLVEWFGGRANTTAGIPVTEDVALTLAAVFAAVRVLANVAAYLPIDVYERQENGDRDIDRDHPASLLIREEPNPDQTAFAFRSSMKARCVLWGNAYAEIERNGRNDPIALWPIHPARVRPDRTKAGRLFYDVLDDPDEPKGSGRAVIPAEDMLHLPNLPPGGNGVVGKSTVAYARDSLGLALGAERTGAAFYANGMRPSGVLSHPETLGKDAQKNLKEQLTARSGSTNFGKVLVLEEGMTWNTMTIPPTDAQFLQTREFQDEEVARWFGVPQHLIGMLKRATNNNIEHQSLEFVIYTLAPWLELEAQEMKRKLLREREKRDWFIEHNLDGLLRGDIEKRTAHFATMRQWGVYNVNEIRRKLNINGIGEQGDVYLQPSNMLDADKAAEIQKPQQQPTSQEPDDDEQDGGDEDQAPNKDSVRAAIRAVVVEALTRMAKIEADNAIRAAKEPAKFMAACDAWEATHWTRFRMAMTPAFAACRSVGIDVDTAAFYQQWTATSRECLIEAAGVAKANDLDGVIARAVAPWTGFRIEALTEELFQCVKSDT